MAGHVIHEHVAAAAIELLGLPMTGARSFTLGLCLRKDVVGAVLRSRGVAVPEWIVVGTGDPVPRWRSFPAIVKPVADDGSYGIRADSVVRDRTELEAALRGGTIRGTGCWSSGSSAAGSSPWRSWATRCCPTPSSTSAPSLPMCRTS